MPQAENEEAIPTATATQIKIEAIPNQKLLQSIRKHPKAGPQTKTKKGPKPVRSAILTSEEFIEEVKIKQEAAESKIKQQPKKRGRPKKPKLSDELPCTSAKRSKKKQK